MKSPHILAALLLGTAFNLQAQTPAPAPAPANGKPALEKLTAKRRSTFTLDKEARSPLWPIGWRPQRNVAVAAPVAITTNVEHVPFDPEMFKVTSIILGNPSLAVINGRSYETGEYLRRKRGDNSPRIRVVGVGDGGVVLQQGQVAIKVPLKRDAIVPKQQMEDEELLDN